MTLVWAEVCRVAEHCVRIITSEEIRRDTAFSAVRPLGQLFRYIDLQQDHSLLY